MSTSNSTLWSSDEAPGNIVVAVCGSISTLLWLLHVRWVKRCYKNLYNVREPVIGVLTSVWMFAMANMWSNFVIPEARLILADIAVLSKVLYCLYVTIHTLALLKIEGWGAREEGIAKLVSVIEEKNLTEKEFRNPVTFAVFWICAGRKFKPTRRWISACTLRIRAGILVIFINGFVVRRIFGVYNQLGGGLGGMDYEHGGFYVDLIELVATMTVASGTVPLQRLLNVIAPSQLRLKFRLKTFFFFFAWICTFQDLIVDAASSGHWFSEKINYKVVGVEMVLVQLMIHKGFIGPPFHWNPIRPYINPSRESVLKTFAFLVDFDHTNSSTDILPTSENSTSINSSEETLPSLVTVVTSQQDVDHDHAPTPNDTPRRRVYEHEVMV
eukprot:m.159959 g.159959  ORF g.159959 m.159959 type:complete len:384 (-) comp31165_c0_seq3:71-1222(-)